MFNDYVKFKKDELFDLFYITLTLAVLFSITFMRFSDSDFSFFHVFFVFFLFLAIVLSLRLLFMKYVAYNNGFEFFLRMTYFDRYGVRFYDRISYTMDGKPVKGVIPTVKASSGIAMPIFSVLVYIFSLGIIIFPCMWRYSSKKIAHLYNRQKHKYEDLDGAQISVAVTNYRMSKVIFAGFLFYFIVALFLKSFSPIISAEFYGWFLFVLYWIGFTSLVPILGTEGYELFYMGRFAWISAITILVLSMIALFIFNSVTTILVTTLICTCIVILVMIYKEMM